MIHKEYITITYGLRGYFAVHIVCDEDGFPEPYQTSPCSYTTKNDPILIEEAMMWASEYGIPFIDWRNIN